MLKRRILFFLIILSIGLQRVIALDFDSDIEGCIPLLDGLSYRGEWSSTFSHGDTPLWLNANRHGLSSLKEGNGYLRLSAIRPLKTDSLRRWGLGYGVDLAVPYNFTSNFVVQQAFVEGRFLHGSLFIGSKEWPMELKNNNLSSGSQTLGINARPVPQVRIALPEYWTFAAGWLHFKGHIAYGKMTDDSFQHDFTSKESKYADDVLYHSKAFYLKIGNPERYFPFSIVLGVESASTFGGKSYSPDGQGGMTQIKGATGFKAYFNALTFGGFDTGEDTYQNAQGNQLGSWLIRLNWDTDDWSFGIYGDKFFEDHSAMFDLDYDGYGEGENWNKKEKSHYILYSAKDMMLGAELNLRNTRFVNDIVFEYLYTKYQSGPIYHDHTETISDHIGGKDNYYNHYIYTGWQHWGQVIGNPLFRSPIYNTDGTLEVKNNRFLALHLGFDGNPWEDFTYRVLLTYQEGLGTYDEPYLKKHHDVSFLLEGRYAFDCKPLKGWSLKVGYGMDFGGILGNNYGAQIAIAKTGLFKK